MLYGFPRYKAIVKFSFLINPKQSACSVMRLAVKSDLFKKTVDPKKFLRSVFYFNIVRNNGREINLFKKNSGGIELKSS
jgi:hypothetical protein